MSTGMGGSPAASKVAGPAIALMVVGALTLLVALYYVVTGAMGGEVAPPPEVQGDPEAVMGQFGFNVNLAGPVAIGCGVLWLVIGGLIIFGGLKMKGLQSYGLAMTASVLAMIPCVSPCCLAGLPIGIWSLVVLMNADVKAAFR